MSEIRRRMMMAQGGEFMPDGYIADGLVFQLDGLHMGDDASTMIDIIGGRVFNLVGGARKTSNGIDFTQAGRYMLGSFPRFDNPHFTVEYVCTQTSFSNPGAFYISNGYSVNYPSLIYRYSLQPRNNGRTVTGIRVAQRRFKVVSISYSDALMDGMTPTLTTGCNDYLFEAGTVGINYPNNNTFNYRGYFHAARIYDRDLSAEEMLHNQQIDNERFNLGLTI